MSRVDAPSLWSVIFGLLDNWYREFGPSLIQWCLTPNSALVTARCRACCRPWMTFNSTDFNPSENCWSKMKAELTRMEARNQERLDDATFEGINLLTLTDIHS